MVLSEALVGIVTISLISLYDVSLLLRMLKLIGVKRSRNISRIHRSIETTCDHILPHAITLSRQQD